jgi:hypothetical protein
MDRKKSAETLIGDAAELDLKKSRKDLRGLTRLFAPDSKPQEPRVIRNVRELYRYQKMSQMAFDLSLRALLNFGNWTFSVGLGLHRGFQAFQACREKFRDEARLRPPIHVSEARAKRELEAMFAEGSARWRD